MNRHRLLVWKLFQEKIGYLRKTLWFKKRGENLWFAIKSVSFAHLISAPGMLKSIRSKKWAEKPIFQRKASELQYSALFVHNGNNDEKGLKSQRLFAQKSAYWGTLENKRRKVVMAASLQGVPVQYIKKVINYILFTNSIKAWKPRV